MKKTVAILLTVLTGAYVLAAGTGSGSAKTALPSGHFLGNGLWKSATDGGSYQAETLINGSTVTSKYTLSDGTKREFTFDMVDAQNGIFKVKIFGAEVGRGYCLDKAQVCHYELKAGNVDLEETITIMDGKLYRFGSKDQGSGRIVWQEAQIPDRE
jgi:hypothetical protein